MDQFSDKGALADSDDFREAMTRHAASVTVVTTDGPAGRAGFTATSVTSLSDEPPMMLICKNLSSSNAGPFQTNGVCCVNILTAAQRPIAEDFAGRTGLSMQKRFARATWSSLCTGAPVLDGALAVFDCRIRDILTVATHAVLVAEVVAIGEIRDGQGLLYTRRDYHRL